MLLDELPAAVGRRLVVEAAVTAASEEASFDDLDAFGRRLRQLGEERNGEVGQLLIVDGLICCYMMAAPEQAATRGFLAPSIEWTNGAVFPPPPDRFPDSVRVYIAERAATTTIAEVAARYHDFIWLRWKDHRNGRAARAAYVSAGVGASLSEAGSAIKSMEHLARAAELAMVLDDERESTRKAIVGEIRRGLAADSLGHACVLAERSAKLLAGDVAEASTLADEFVDAADRVKAIRQYHRDRSYSETAAVLAKAIADTARAQSSRERLALSFEAEARAAPSGMLAQHWFAEAIRVRRNLGNAADVERLKPLMREASERMVSEMKPISASTTIPTDAIERATAATSLATDGSPESLLALPEELGIWPDWQQVEDESQREASAHPLLSLMPMVKVEADARVQPEPDDEAEREVARQVRSYSQRTAVLLGLCRLIVDELRRRERWSDRSVLDALARAGDDLAASAARGVTLHEEGDYWSATHVLVPQVERAVRLLGRVTGAEIERIASDSGFRWATLDGLLADQRVRDALGESFATELEALLVNAHGWNLRNNVAHGALDPDASHQSTSLLGTFMLLSIASRIARVTAGSATSSLREPADG
jgi:uncharacterized protein DUF4209